jgi:protein DGCR14
MFGPDADVDPLKRPPNASSVSELRQNPPEISHDNTRMRDEDDLEPSRNSGRSSARASSPTRSRVAAAIGGTPCRSEFFDTDISDKY